MSIGRELRIMHACEVGAVGVYRGHKCVARYFFRENLAELDNMRFHEKDHAHIFKGLLEARSERLCYASRLFFIGGLFYGVIIGLLGLRAIGTSTFTIENIVNKEFELALRRLQCDELLCSTIREIQLEEQQHRDSGKELIGSNYPLFRLVEKLARAGAYTAKTIASRL